MSWTSINTTGDAVLLTRAEQVRRTHRRIRRGLRRICGECGGRWGDHGCALRLWAIDVLSRMSRIVIPDPPDRPKHRHRPGYVKLLAQGAAQARNLYRIPRPQPGW